jgi:hypothetical protein
VRPGQVAQALPSDPFQAVAPEGIPSQLVASVRVLRRTGAMSPAKTGKKSILRETRDASFSLSLLYFKGVE